MLLLGAWLLQNEEEARQKGQVVPDDPFDSNCITPGTEFMARLGKHLRFFIRRKVAEDPLWQKPAVVFSGEQTVQGGVGAGHTGGLGAGARLDACCCVWRACCNPHSFRWPRPMA